MAILSVREHWNGRTGSWTPGAVRHYVRVFHVFTTDTLTSAMEVLLARDLTTGRRVPQMFDPYTNYRETDVGALCLEIDPRQDTENPKKWEVTCTYRSPDPGARGGGQATR